MQIQLRRDSIANWETANPVLASGEIAFVTIDGLVTDMKIGDGITTFINLPFYITNTNKALVNNLTKADIGLELANNTSDSSKVVASAAKLTTPRTVALSGQVSGTTTFDGSGNVDISTTLDLTNITGNIIPGGISGTLNIGSPAQRFKGIYVDEAYLSVNTLYIGDTPILGTDADSVIIEADTDQSIAIKTSGIGTTSLTSGSGVLMSTNGFNADVTIQSTGVNSKVRMAAAAGIELSTPTLVDSTLEVTGDMTVNGNLILNGTTTTVNSTTVTTTDNIIVLNDGEAGVGVTSGTAGLQIDRGDAAAAQFVFNEATDKFTSGIIGQAYETMATEEYITSILGNVNNTSDFDKPISSATSTALGGKVANDRVLTDVPLNAVFTDTVYDDTTIASAVYLNTQKVSNITTNLSTLVGASDITIVSSDGTNATIAPATTLVPGIMTKETYVEHVNNNNKVSNVDHPLVQTAVPVGAVFTDTETTTTLSLAANILTYVDEAGNSTELDLSLYLDDTNLATLTSGTVNGTTGIATFSRSDNSTFTVDFSALLDDSKVTVENVLTSTTTTSALSAAQGKVLKDVQVTQETAIGLNTAKVGITTAQADAIVANTAKVGITTAQADAIVASTTELAKIASGVTKGDILVYNGTSFVVLPKGTDGQFLKADSTSVTGLAWGIVTL